MWIFDYLFTWVAVIVVVPLIIAFGWVVVSIPNPQFNVAQWAFTFAAVILAGRIGLWITLEHGLKSLRNGQVLFFSFFVFGVIGCVWIAGLQWVDGLRPAVPSVPPSLAGNVPKDHTQPLPNPPQTTMPSASPPKLSTAPASDPVGNLSKLGWAVKRDGKLLQFEISYAPLPNMEQSKILFEALREPFRLSFQGVPNLNGLNKVSSVSECKEIQISASELDNVNELRGFASLKKLSISQVPLNGRNELDISSLQSLVSVEALNLNGSRVTTLEPIAAMHHLGSLNIGMTLIRDLSPISQLAELTTVDVGGSNVTDLSPLLASKGLQEIGIDGKQASSRWTSCSTQGTSQSRPDSGTTEPRCP